MRAKNIPLLTIMVPLLLLVWSCSKRKKTEVVWDQNPYITGSQSSPRAVDLNRDGVLDIVMGAGKNEYQPSDEGILAFDGKTGELLWTQPATDQVYGSATFYDVTGDSIPDVFIGGRSPHFKALDGKTGSLLWEYQYSDHEKDSILKYARFNFNNSVLIPDQNNDGLSDLLTVNGGNAKAEPNSNKNRFPGVLMIMDSKTGNILAADTMPDGRESYLSPIVFTQPDASEPSIIFGTGGETIDGHLYRATLSDLRHKSLANATVLASEKGHGFIAPPSAADINGDGYYDVVAISHGSTVFALDGKTNQLLWKQSFPQTESSNSLAVGFFTDDDVPDFFTFISKGQWPNSTGSLQIMLDGKDGNVAYRDSIGCTGFSSPVVYDLNDDGIDEALISVNEFDCSLGFTGKAPQTMMNKLIAVNFSDHSTQVIEQAKDFKNIFSTPWLGDMDHDGYLDIVHCQYYHRGDLMLFLGMRIKRISTGILMNENPRWNAYMGQQGNGLFKK